MAVPPRQQSRRAPPPDPTAPCCVRRQSFYGLANLEDIRRSGDEADDDLLWRTPIAELAAQRRGLTGLIAADLSTEQERKLRRAVFGFDRCAFARAPPSGWVTSGACSRSKPARPAAREPPRAT
jgi:hypothetical protein